MSRLLNIIFLCLSTAFLFSGTDGTIRGQVLDVNGEGIPGVQILIEELYQGAITDLDGNYIILNIQENLGTKKEKPKNMEKKKRKLRTFVGFFA